MVLVDVSMVELAFCFIGMNASMREVLESLLKGLLVSGKQVFAVEPRAAQLYVERGVAQMFYSGIMATGRLQNN